VVFLKFVEFLKVIPAKLAIASASGNPGNSKPPGCPFREHDGEDANDLFNMLLKQAGSRHSAHHALVSQR